MSLRVWVIRGLILAGVALLAAFGWLANSWVSPERVRAQVIAHLTEQLEGVEVHVGSAHMRILGGIAVTDLKLTRTGPDGTHTPLLAVPAAILYHDKEQLNRGRLVIKKVELEHPELLLERGPDGKWNVAEVLKIGPTDRAVPTFVIKGGTIHIRDQSADPLPTVTLTDTQLTLLNDPLPVLAIQARAMAKGYGAVNARARVNRLTGGLSLGLEMPAFPLGDVLATTAAKFVPQLAPHLGGLSATAAVSADLNYTPDAARKWKHDVRLDLKDARYTHAEIPWPVEKINASVKVLDGKVTLQGATAQINGAAVTLSLETREHKPAADHKTDDLMQQLEDHLQKFDLSVAGVTLDDNLFKHLSDHAKQARRRFSPDGKVDVGYRFTREAGGWKREFEVRPKQLTMAYEKFKYPVGNLGGIVKRTTTHATPPSTAIDLTGTAGGQIITIKGTVTGEGDDPGINVRIAGNNVPLDDAVVAAFPPKYAEIIRQFHASGRGDFVAVIAQQPGVNLCENEFHVEIRDATMNYDQFPYPLKKVKGRLVVRVATSDPTRGLHRGDKPGPPPDRDEIVLDGFTAEHAGATVWLNGSRRPIPGSKDRKLTLRVGGNNCPIDADLKTAVARLRVDSIWTTFAPRGNLTFSTDIELIDRAGVAGRPEPPINPATDLKMSFNFSGPTVTPSFFPYELTDLMGMVEYKNGRVDLMSPIVGRHGESRFKLGAGEIRLYPDGAVWANLGGLEVKPLVADAAFIKALPGKLGSGLDELKLKGGAELFVKWLVVLTPPDPPGIPPPDPGPISPVAPVGQPLPNPSPIRGGAFSPPSLSGKGAGGLGSSFTARGQSPTPTLSPQSQQPDPVVFWDAELRLAGASLDTGVAWEQVFGAIACRGRYEGTHMGLLRGAIWLDRAVIARQPVTRVSGRVKADPQKLDPTRPGEHLPVELEFTDLAGDFFHGVLGGECRVVLAQETHYDLLLIASDVQLEEVAKHYKLGSDADLKGIAQAKLRLHNRPDPKTGLLTTEGTGTIDVPTGRMYNLPILLDLMKLAKGNAPDKTAFEEAHAVLRIQGDRVKVEQVDLIGKAICLGGSGELDTSGDYVKFDFYTIPSQVLAQLVNTPVGDLTAFLSKKLFKIKLTRENGELKYKPEVMPVVTEPARAAADRLRARTAKMFGGSGK